MTLSYFLKCGGNQGPLEIMVQREEVIQKSRKRKKKGKKITTKKQI